MGRILRRCALICAALALCLCVPTGSLAKKRKKKHSRQKATSTVRIVVPPAVTSPPTVALTTADQKSAVLVNNEFGVGRSSSVLREEKIRTPGPAPAATAPPPSVLISELRLRGPAGTQDEFIEIYNNGAAPLAVQASDTSAGWTIAGSNGQITGPICTIPNGTIIPARGHLLCANANGYSLSSYPGGDPNVLTTAPNVAAPPPFAPTTPDRTFDFDLPDDFGIALFSTTNGPSFNAATRLDAFGFTISPALFKEGNGFPFVQGGNSEHTFYRDLRNSTPKDTNDNAADFRLVATSANLQTNLNGSPGPENLKSPIVNNVTIGFTLLDPSNPSTSPPNRERRPNVETNANLGLLLIRRTVTNNTGAPVTRLRFRVVDITTRGTASGACGGTPCADLRLLTSQDGEAGVGGQIVIVRGLRHEESPFGPQAPEGGGLNSSASADFITLQSPLLPGQSANIVFKLGVMQPGAFRFFINIEALNGTPPPAF